MKKLMFGMKKAAFVSSLVCVSASVFGMENQRWFEAVRSGNFSRVDQVVDEKSTNTRDRRDERTDLISAAESNNLEMVDHLLNIDHKEDEALELILKWRGSIELGERDRQQHLRSWKAAVDVYAENIWRRTALISAAEKGNKEMIRLLLNEGADVNAKDKDGRTALMDAVWQEDEEIVQLLLDKGADVNAVMKNASTALGLALSGKGNVPARNREMISLLLERGADASAALADVARSGSLKSVQFLVGKGAAVNFADASYGVTPLMHAAWHGHKEIVAFLLAQKAAVNMANKSGNTELWHAATNGHTAIVKLLIKKGAAIDKTNHAGITPLMEAAARGHADVVRLLLARGAALNLKNNKGEITPATHPPVRPRCCLLAADAARFCRRVRPRCSMCAARLVHRRLSR